MFEVPEDFTHEQVQELFVMWETFVVDGTNAGHVPTTDCEECEATFASYVESIQLKGQASHGER